MYILSHRAALVVATATIVALTALLVEAGKDGDVVDLLNSCEKCVECYECITFYTGQDLIDLCTTGNVVDAMFCASQAMHIYDKKNKHAKNDILCWKQCKKCPKCLGELDLTIPQLATTLWEEVYPTVLQFTPEDIVPDSSSSSSSSSSSEESYEESKTDKQFTLGSGDIAITSSIQQGTTEEEDDVDDDDFSESEEDDNWEGDDDASEVDDSDSSEDDDDEDSDNPFSKKIDNEFSNRTLSRRKREIITFDGDSCCQTQRIRTVFTSEFLDELGQTWYPVWMFKAWESPPYLFQLYDDIVCPIVNPLCSNNLVCTTHFEPRSFLMSRNPPHPETGYTYIFLHYPSDTVQFFDLITPCYCRCTN